MPRAKKQTNPIDHIPPLQGFVALVAALQTYHDDELAQVMVKRLSKASEQHRKELAQLVREQEKATIHDAQHPPKPPPDLKSLEGAVKTTSSAIESLLKKAGKAAELADAHKTHTGTVAVAEALVTIAEQVQNKAVRATAEELRSDLDAFKLAESRVKAGGHEAFDDKTARVITHLWIEYDAGFDVLGACMRAARVSYDPVYASRVTTKSPLRPEIFDRDPNQPNPKPVGRPKGQKKGGKTASGNGATQGTPQGEVKLTPVAPSDSAAQPK